MEKTDDELIAEYRAGTPEGFKHLIERYARPLYVFIARMTNRPDEAEDISQETFVKVWKTLERYKLTGTFKAWIYTIARNTALDHLRKKKIPVFSDFEDAAGKNTFLESLSDPDTLPATLIEKAERKGLVGKALAELSPEDKEILTLHYAEDMTFDAIGEIVGKPLNTVKSRHRRALGKLREFLEKQP